MPDIYSQHAETFAEFGIGETELLQKAWREPHRFYHTEQHLASLLARIASLPNNLQEKKILQMAAFFHDAVRFPTKQDNEQRSAAFFKSLSQPHPDSDSVVSIILDLKKGQAGSELSALFFRLDHYLFQEGSFPELLEWEKQMFKEYQCFDYPIYKENCLTKVAQLKGLYPQNATNLQYLVDYLHSYVPKIGVYPGSFNPFHNGHLNILEKAEKVFDKVIIARGINPSKDGIAIDNAEINPVLYYRQTENFAGLLTDYLSNKETHADVTLIRGLRNGDDLAYEMNQIAFMNEMKEGLKVVFFHCDRQFEHISSSAIRNLDKIGEGYSEAYIPKLPFNVQGLD